MSTSLRQSRQRSWDLHSVREGDLGRRPGARPPCRPRCPRYPGLDRRRGPSRPRAELAARGIDWPGAAQVLRIRRDTGPAHGHWAAKEIAYGITSLPPRLPRPPPPPRPAAGPRRGPPPRAPPRPAAPPAPRPLPIPPRQHWAIENGSHYVRDVTFREDAQKARTGNLPANCAALRNLAIGAARKVGFANIAHARRHYARDDQHILELYGYT